MKLTVYRQGYSNKNRIVNHPFTTYFLLVSILFLQACTTIEITEAEGTVSIERRFGLSIIRPSEKAGVITAKISTLGYTSTPLGKILGYSNQSILLADESCRVVIWIGSRLSQEEKNTLRKLQTTCLIEE